MNLDADLVDCSSTLPFNGEPGQVGSEDCLQLTLPAAAWLYGSPFGSGSGSAVRLRLNSDPIAIRLGLVFRLTRTSWQHSVHYFNLVGLRLVALS